MPKKLVGDETWDSQDCNAGKRGTDGILDWHMQPSNEEWHHEESASDPKQPGEQAGAETDYR